jgi:hypothetical protein
MKGIFEMEKISADAFVANYATTDEYKEIEFCDTSFMLREHVDIESMMKIVNTVVKACFIDDGEFRPELKDFVFRWQVIEEYTNIKLPEETRDQYRFVYESGVFGTVMNAIDNEQINAIVRSIDEKIRYIADSNINELESKLNELYNSAKVLVDRIEDSMSGVDSDTITKIASAFSGDGAINTEELAKALIAARN